TTATNQRRGNDAAPRVTDCNRAPDQAAEVGQALEGPAVAVAPHLDALDAEAPEHLTAQARRGRVEQRSGRPVAAQRAAGREPRRPVERRRRSEEHTSELQSRFDLVCRLLLEKKKRSAHAE